MFCSQSLNFWRIRLLLLPVQQLKYLTRDEEDNNALQSKYIQGFLRFLETLNRIRRPAAAESQSPTKSRRPSTPTVTKSPLSSVRTHRRNRSGEGSKDLETLDENEIASLDVNQSPRHQDTNKYNYGSQIGHYFM